LFTNWSTRSNLFLVQSQTQLRTFVFGLWGNTTLSKCLQTRPHLLTIPYLHHYSHTDWTSNWYYPCSLAHSELSTVFYDKVLLLAWG
jgi:hypothetical protein